jgi:hypothetical protein
MCCKTDSAYQNLTATQKNISVFYAAGFPIELMHDRIRALPQLSREKTDDDNRQHPCGSHVVRKVAGRITILTATVIAITEGSRAHDASPKCSIEHAFFS